MPTILAIDFGTKKLGIAIGETLTHNSFPLDILPALANEPNWDKLDEIVKHWQPQLVLIGYPLGITGSKNKMTSLVDDFAKIISDRYEIPIELVDERFSSYEARALRKDLPKKKSKSLQQYDNLSAIMIMNYWFEST